MFNRQKKTRPPFLGRPGLFLPGTCIFGDEKPKGRETGITAAFTFPLNYSKIKKSCNRMDVGWPCQSPGGWGQKIRAELRKGVTDNDREEIRLSAGRKRTFQRSVRLYGKTAQQELPGA
ncbi:hypothetical protein CLOM621_08836 [Clostridium sp. M62/1]|nr:hypothetical protein CLOM621_08836 [Clostridium sp. M62/1]